MTTFASRVDIAVMAKAPIAGFAKTRLIPALGEPGAARLHRELTRHAIATAVAAAMGVVTVWCAPDATHRFFRALSRRSGLSLLPQSTGDLGDRMLAAFERQPTGVPLLVIGTDCPPLTAAHLRDAGAALTAGRSATFVPAEDGGYALVGLRCAIPALFCDMPWGTEHVMALSRDRLRALGLSWHEGETLWDVDRPDDLRKMAAHRDAQR